MTILWVRLNSSTLVKLAGRSWRPSNWLICTLKFSRQFTLLQLCRTRTHWPTKFTVITTLKRQQTCQPQHRLENQTCCQISTFKTGNGTLGFLTAIVKPWNGSGSRGRHVTSRSGIRRSNTEVSLDSNRAAMSSISSGHLIDRQLTPWVARVADWRPLMPWSTPEISYSLEETRLMDGGL